MMDENSAGRASEEAVEAVARAIVTATRSDPDEMTYITDDGVMQPYGPRWTRYEDEARAAIAALSTLPAPTISQDVPALAAVVREAALALVAKLDECQPHIDDAFVHRHLRCGDYTGPNYGKELVALTAALSAATPLQSDLAGENVRPDTGGEVQYEVYEVDPDGDDMMIASSDSEADARHYLAVYGQDGPVKLVRAVTYRTALTGNAS